MQHYTAYDFGDLINNEHNTEFQLVWKFLFLTVDDYY